MLNIALSNIAAKSNITVDMELSISTVTTSSGNIFMFLRHLWSKILYFGISCISIKMFYIGMTVLCIGIIEISLFTFSSHAATPEEQYAAATNCYQSLKNSTERQKYRHNWQSCIQKFQVVYTDDPDNSLASSGMYRTAELYIALYRISSLEKDKAEAIDLLNRIIKRYPYSTDRDMAEKRLEELNPDKQSVDKNRNKHLNKEDVAAVKNVGKEESAAVKNVSKEESVIVSDGNAYITDLRYWTTPDYTRIAINISDERRYVYQFLDENPSMKQPQRIYLDIKKSLIGKNLPSHTRINDELLLQARAGQYKDDTVRVVVDIKSFESYKVFSMRDPFRVIVDVWGDKSGKTAEGALSKAESIDNKADNKTVASVSLSESKVLSVNESTRDSTQESNSTQGSDLSSTIDSDIPIKRATKKSTRTSTGTVSEDDPSSSDNISSKVSTKTSTKSSSAILSKTNVKEAEPVEIDSETDSKAASHLPVKKSLKASTMVISDATRRLLRESLKSYEDTSKIAANTKEQGKIDLEKSSRPATKGTTRVVQIAPGSNVDKIKASSIAKQLALGVRTIVIDPGHGGKDPGASSHAKGIYEKDIVLAISKKLSRQIKDRLGCNVIMTRSSDTYLTLEERTAIANTNNTDLFISLHCNASNDSTLFGIETYYLNLATDERAINVAARENATSKKNISDLESILNDLMKNAKINESSRLAAVVQSSLYKGMAKQYSRVRNLGVKQAPFYVLLGASMPSILIETSFLSNQEEGRRLNDSAYQNALCNAITDGIAKYIRETNPQRL